MQIISKQREDEVELSKGNPVTEVVRKLGVTERAYYRCHIIEMKGESYRLKEAKRRKKKTP